MTTTFATDLTDLAVGNAVLVRSGWGYSTYSSATVTRLTATQVVVTNLSVAVDG